ncbi:MAG: phospho-N-acetylmuramoyl-pentapeptide-transferase, partial [Casimicrobiaceae bacterium]
MLLALANWIAGDVRTFNVFTYITLRSVLATMTALVISFVVGPRMIRKLTEYKIGQAVRDDGPQTHLIKAGTPTMGGALILVSIVVTTLLWADLRNRFVWVVLLVTLGFGTVGWIDDYRKVVHRNPKGLSVRKKLVLQSLIGLVAAIYLAFSVSTPSTSQFLQLFHAWLSSGFSVSLSPKADLIVPFFKTVSYPLGVWGFIILSYCVIVGASNAVNLTDGL